ncbi:MAG: hypothetical protein GXY64_00750 [Bacteroidales bacterium]|nr:hypothetical protein [Bacteroidales bacterium]
MNIGDKVRFLNDVGGGTITAFRPGGIVLVEDADGFEVPVPVNEVIVIDEGMNTLPSKKEKRPKVTTTDANTSKDHLEGISKASRRVVSESSHLNLFGKEVAGTSKLSSRESTNDSTTESASISGGEYLKNKTVATHEAEDEVDENLEARVVCLEMTIQKLEARIALLEAENNLRKNEKLLRKSSKQGSRAGKSNNLEELQIL